MVRKEETKRKIENKKNNLNDPFDFMPLRFQKYAR